MMSNGHDPEGLEGSGRARRAMPWRRAGGRRGVALVALASVVALVAGCSGGSTESASSKPGEETVTIGVPVVAEFVLGALLAPKLKEFTDRGVHVEIKQVSSPDALVLLATGKLDAFMGPISAGTFNAVANGSDIKIVAPGGTNPDSNWWISNAALGGEDYSLDSWKGKKIYTSTGAGSYVMISLAHILKPAGLKVTDLEFAQIPPADVVPALESGAIFAGIPPTAAAEQSLRDSGAAFPGPSAVWPEGIPPGYLQFGKRLLEDEPELGQRVVDAFYDVYTNRFQGAYDEDPELQPLIADALQVPVAQVPDLVRMTYDPAFTFPEGFAKEAEDVWRSIPDVLSYDDSVADDIVAEDLMATARKQGN
jgi:ABC-type nitrate/sulfonate/bicarbonate transport system substrate-binding protein